MPRKKAGPRKGRIEISRGTKDIRDANATYSSGVSSEQIEEEFSLESQQGAGPGQATSQRRKGGSRGRARAKAEKAQVLSYRHADKRKNNPEVGMVKPENDPAQPKTAWQHDPHLDPALQFDIGRSQIEKFIDDALEGGDHEQMRAALVELKRLQQPYLNWTGKAEGTSFEVDTVSLHVHERIDPASILSVVRKRVAEGKSKAEFLQSDLFAAPFENLPLRDAIDFYRHERGWANRLIAGDSLLVMNSLLRKESMAGRVQMIYIDPPYGIKYGSNFQPFVNKRDVKDRKDEDLTQEPEMVKAFRDTWELGIHSYLTYLRDRLLLAKELLHESGSLFVQISDENLHHVRELGDEVFGPQNFVSLVTFAKTTGQTSEFLSNPADYLLWFAKDKQLCKFRPAFRSKVTRSDGDFSVFQFLETETLERRKLTQKELQDPTALAAPCRIYSVGDLTSQRQSRASGPGSAMYFEVQYEGRSYVPTINRGWTTNREGMAKLIKARRVQVSGDSLRLIRYFNDFPWIPVNAVWSDTGTGSFLERNVYVVQTAFKAIERCVLMTTEPGDLVLDPTCGSGTTALVAEKWGRRWITCDTSRVAVTLAKQRLMTGGYEYYALRYPHQGLKAGFIYETVPHITLRSIANNPEIDEIYERMHPAIEAALAELNKAAKQSLKEWEVPYDFPGDWSDSAKKPFEQFHAARQSMQKRMDESIAAHADQETLYDQPQVDRNKLRISGPFTVEAVPFPTVLSLEEAEQPKEADVAIARSGESARQHSWRDELLKTGIRGKGGQMLKFADLETLPDTRYLHASGTVAETGERAVVSFGPPHAALEQRQVALALNEAEKLRPAPKFVIFCAFAFDPEAAKDIDETQWPGVTLLKTQMNTDLLTEDLKKARASNQSFWLMGQPDVEVRKRNDGKYEVEVHGFDYFDTAKGELISGGKSKIAVWLLDTDYDERSLFPRQVFFPMAGKSDGWMKLKKDIRAELNESLLAKFHGTVSLPFEAGDNQKIAVKIVDDRGIESLKILPLD